MKRAAYGSLLWKERGMRGERGGRAGQRNKEGVFVCGRGERGRNREMEIECVKAGVVLRSREKRT